MVSIWPQVGVGRVKELPDFVVLEDTGGHREITISQREHLREGSLPVEKVVMREDLLTQVTCSLMRAEVVVVTIGVATGETIVLGVIPCRLVKVISTELLSTWIESVS